MSYPYRAFTLDYNCKNVHTTIYFLKSSQHIIFSSLWVKTVDEILFTVGNKFGKNHGHKITQTFI